MSRARAHILLTRSEEDCVRMRELLHARNVDAEIHVVPCVSVLPSFSQIGEASIPYKGVILTSRHALPACRSRAIPKNTAFFVVGEECKKQLQDLGYVNVRCFATVRALVAGVSQGIASRRSPDPLFLYLRGKEVSLDLKAALASEIQVIEAVVYRVEMRVDGLKEVLKTLHGVPMILPLFSVQMARGLAGAIKASHAASIHKTTVIAMSEAIAESVSHHPWKKIAVAAAPHLQSVIDSVMVAVEEHKINSPR